MLRGKWRVGGCSTRIVHHHDRTDTPSAMNLWTCTPSFPLDYILVIKIWISCGSWEEDDRPLQPYLPMTSSIRHFSFDLFASLRRCSRFQWKPRGLPHAPLFDWNLLPNASNGTQTMQKNVESMNKNTFVAFMPSIGHLLQVDDDRCYGCAACIMVCPVDALRLQGWLVEIDHATCTLCDHCLPSCPVDALSMELTS